MEFDYNKDQRIIVGVMFLNLLLFLTFDTQELVLGDNLFREITSIFCDFTYCLYEMTIVFVKFNLWQICQSVILCSHR